MWLGAVAALLLGGCSSLMPGATEKLRAIDYANDDVADLLIAFDVPLTLEPVPDASTMSFRVGTETLVAVLARADLDAVAGTLPPPGRERTYYLFGFSETDKAKVRELQAKARATTPSGGGVTVAMAPLFCRNAEIDPKQVRFSVLLSVPGKGGLQPLFSNAVLADVLAQVGGATLPECAGHSG
jgi:hypothetical protein